MGFIHRGNVTKKMGYEGTAGDAQHEMARQAAVQGQAAAGEGRGREGCDKAHDGDNWLRTAFTGRSVWKVLCPGGKAMLSDRCCHRGGAATWQKDRSLYDMVTLFFAGYKQTCHRPASVITASQNRERQNQVPGAVALNSCPRGSPVCSNGQQGTNTQCPRAGGPPPTPVPEESGSGHPRGRQEPLVEPLRGTGGGRRPLTSPTA